MVTVLKEIEIDGETRRYPVFLVPCGMEELLELTRADLDMLHGARVAVEEEESL